MDCLYQYDEAVVVNEHHWQFKEDNIARWYWTWSNDVCEI